MIQIIFGWPGIIAFIGIATWAAWRPNHWLMLAALFLALPNTLYLAGANNWIRLAALYVALSLFASVVLIRNRKDGIPRLLLVPVYIFYAYLGYAVLNQ